MHILCNEGLANFIHLVWFPPAQNKNVACPMRA